MTWIFEGKAKRGLGENIPDMYSVVSLHISHLYRTNGLFVIILWAGLVKDKQAPRVTMTREIILLLNSMKVSKLFQLYRYQTQCSETVKSTMMDVYVESLD